MQFKESQTCAIMHVQMMASLRPNVTIIDIHDHKHHRKKNGTINETLFACTVDNMEAFLPIKKIQLFCHTLIPTTDQFTLVMVD